MKIIRGIMGQDLKVDGIHVEFIHGFFIRKSDKLQPLAKTS